MTRIGRSRPGSSVLACRAAAVAVVVSVVVSLAASVPLALASPFPQSVVEDVTAWLDRALPPDAVAGAEIPIGATIWNERFARPLAGASIFFRLAAADGGGDFSEVVGIEDWPGHFVASLVVPVGGVGELRIGTQGSACDANGCNRSDAIYEIAGVGPPPDAPLATIATATTDRPTNPFPAGLARDVTVRVIPRAAGDPAAFTFPAQVRVVIREPRGPALDVVVAAGSAGAYAAAITLPSAGEFALQVAAIGDGTVGADATVAAADLFAASTVRVTAQEAATEPPDLAPSTVPSGGPGSPTDDLSERLVPLAAAVAIAILGLGALFAIGRRPA